jgi:hypothetical protein
MNASEKRSHAKRHLVKPLVLAVALALPTGAAFSASMTDIVTTRADQNVDEQYGRESVFAFSPDAKPLKPEQTAGDSNFFGAIGGFAAATWDRFTGLFGGDDDASGATQTATVEELRGYGRAGGFVGADRITVLESDNPYVANSDLVIVGDTIVGTGGGTRAPMSDTAAVESMDQSDSAGAAPTVEQTDTTSQSMQQSDASAQNLDQPVTSSRSLDQSDSAAVDMDEPANVGTQSGSNLAQ